MLSILKILFTLAVIVVVYLGFKYRWRLTDMGRAMARMSGSSGGGSAPPPGRTGPPVVRDLVPCPRCGAYVAAGIACSCEKA
jgi:hypothetical protein